MSKNQHPEDVKAAVRKTGLSLSELARRNGFSTSSARKCLYFPVPTANRAIADHLGIPVQDIWPEWFDKDGNRRIGQLRSDSNTAPVSAHRQKRSAA